MNEGRPNIVDLVKTGKVDMIINTPLGRESFYDEKSIRRAAIRYNIPCITTLSAANAAARGIRALVEQTLEVSPLQSLHSKKAAAPHCLPRVTDSAATDSPCHSERSEESLFGLDRRRERFLGTQRASE